MPMLVLLLLVVMMVHNAIDAYSMQMSIQQIVEDFGNVVSWGLWLVLGLANQDCGPERRRGESTYQCLLLTLSSGCKF